MEQRRSDQERLNNQPPRVKPPEANQNHQPPPPQKCPRCDSSNTKFCYYNNYSLSQPRYFCKACRRYWTHGGTLRNVPVGGGCRKSKRPKPSVPSPSVSQPSLPPQSLTALNSGQVMRPLPPIMSYGGGGGSFLSSLAAMQSLSAGINQGAVVNLGGGGRQYDSNMGLLSLQSLKPHQAAAPLQIQLQNDQYFQPQQNLSIPARPPVSSWTQSFINRDPSIATTTSAAATSNFWSGATDTNDGAGSSFNPNHWQDNNQGFDPSSQ